MKSPYCVEFWCNYTDTFKKIGVKSLEEAYKLYARTVRKDTTNVHIVDKYGTLIK